MKIVLIGTTVSGMFWICDSLWGEPLLDPKKLQNQQFYIIDWIRNKSWSMLPIWLLAAMMIMMYYWRFWEPCTNAMLVVLLPKLWFWIENHDWAQQFWMSSWGSPLLDPKKLQNQQFYQRKLGSNTSELRMTFTWCNWLWWKVVDHVTIHNVPIHHKRIRSNEIDLEEGW